MTGYNLPPGVTGSEYEIAGPDYEVESGTLCPLSWYHAGALSWTETCRATMMEQGFGRKRWLICAEGHRIDLAPSDPGDDPDRKYDEERDRRMLSDQEDYE